MSDTATLDFSLYDSRPWLKHYGSNVAHDLPPLEYQSVPDMVRQSSKTYRDNPAFSVCLPNGMGGTLTYGDVDQKSDAFAAYLRHTLGLKQGDRVAIQMPNCLTYPIAAFGISKAGCVLVNVNPLYTVSEMDHQLNDAGATVLIIIDMFVDKLPEVLDKTPVNKVLTVSVADFFPTLPKLIVKTVLKLKKQIPALTVSAEPFTQALEQGAEALSQGKGLDDIKIKIDDLFALQYTGGTTGRSKGAMLTHSNVVSNISQSQNGMREQLRPGEAVALTALPLYHIFALGIAGIFYSLGGHNVLIPSPRPVSNLRKAFEKYNIQFFSGVNTLFNGLLHEEWFLENPPKNLDVSLAGGTALQNFVADRWKEVIGYEIFQGYGLSETSPIVTATPLDGPVKQGSIGIPNASCYVRLVDDEGRPVPLGDPGELIVKGPQVMKGYWNRPDATAESIKDDWFYTGDIAVMDEDGFFSIVDRKKDMVIVSGFNVYPNEIEDVISNHPDVLEAGVIGVPDDSTGEAVRAYVVKREPDLTEENLIAHCRESLTAYKVPKEVIFVDDIPKTPVGKVLRKDLRALSQG